MNTPTHERPTSSYPGLSYIEHQVIPPARLAYGSHVLREDGRYLLELAGIFSGLAKPLDRGGTDEDLSTSPKTKHAATAAPQSAPDHQIDYLVSLHASTNRVVTDTEWYREDLRRQYEDTPPEVISEMFMRSLGVELAADQ